LILVALASRDATVCANRLAMWELMVMAMVSAVLSSETSSSIALFAWKGAKWLQDVQPPCPAVIVPEARQC
jgi:hypothetical protein